MWNDKQKMAINSKNECICYDKSLATRHLPQRQVSVDSWRGPRDIHWVPDGYNKSEHMSLTFGVEAEYFFLQYAYASPTIFNIPTFHIPEILIFLLNIHIPTRSIFIFLPGINPIQTTVVLNPVINSASTHDWHD